MSTTIERERRKLLWLKEKVAEQERFVADLERRQHDPLDQAFERDFGVEAAPAASAQAPAQPRPTGSDAFMAKVQAVVESLPPADLPILPRDGVTFRPTGPWAGQWTRDVRRLPANWSRVIEFIGGSGKSLKEVMEFIKINQLGLADDTVRAGLMNYRRDFGLIENPKRGYYVATQKALDIIAATKNESPAVTGGALESQPQKEVADLA